MNTPLLLCLTMWPLSAALANDDALSRCRSVQDDRVRLKCYDAIVLPVSASASAVAAKQPPPGDGGVATTAAPVGPAAATAAAADFGLERQAAEAAAAEVRSTIPGLLKGWDAQTRFRLANGQLWAVADGSRAAYRLTDPPVRITRAMLGGFRMEIEGVPQLLRVRRLE